MRYLKLSLSMLVVFFSLLLFNNNAYAATQSQDFKTLYNSISGSMLRYTFVYYNNVDDIYRYSSFDKPVNLTFTPTYISNGVQCYAVYADSQDGTSFNVREQSYYNTSTQTNKWDSLYYTSGTHVYLTTGAVLNYASYDSGNVSSSAFVINGAPTPTTPQDIVNKFQFTGYSFYKPFNGDALNSNVFQCQLNASIPNTISWGSNNNTAYDSTIRAFEGEISRTAIIQVNGVNVNTTLNFSVVSTANSMNPLQLIIKFPVTLTGGSNTITFGSNVITQFNVLSSNSRAWYSASVSFTNTVPVDVNGDGVDDNTGKSIDKVNDSSGLPVRSSYPDGIIGDVQFGFDTLVYYVTAPFRLIGQAISNLVSYASSATTVLTPAMSFFNTLFSFLPAPISGLIYLLFSMFILVGVVRLIRG